MNVSVIHDRLRDEIVSGRIPPGETSQAALARELGVSRTPLREAIRMLQREGLVITEPNRRVRVAELSATDCEEVAMMRAALEGVAIRLTVPTLGSDGIAELEGLLAQMEHYRRANDPRGYRAPHHAFHARLVAAGGERVATSCALLVDHAERYLVTFSTTTPEIWERRSVEHRALVDAAAAGDADLAVRRLLEHYGSFAENVFNSLDGEYEPDRLRVALASIAPGSERSLDGIWAGAEQ